MQKNFTEHLCNQPAEQVISWAEKNIQSDQNLQETERVLNWRGGQIVSKNQETKFLPPLTKLYEKTARKIGNGKNYFKNKIESTGIIRLDSPITKGRKKGENLSFQTAIGMRHKSIWIDQNKQEILKTITDLILFGLQSRATEHLPWGLDYSEEKTLEFLKHSGNNFVGAVWDAILLHEIAKNKINTSASAGIVRREWPQKLKTGNPIIFSNGLSFDELKKSRTPEELIRAQKKSIFRMIEQMLQNPQKESGYQKIKNATSRMTEKKARMY